jgi:hypothetical protein
MGSGDSCRLYPGNIIGGELHVPTQVVTYQVDESTVVSFEVEPGPGFHPAGAGEIAGQVRNAISPAVDAAKVVLEKVKETKPDEVEVRFGVKVSGGASWLIARATAEGSFEITLRWSPGARAREPARTVEERSASKSGTAAAPRATR